MIMDSKRQYTLTAKIRIKENTEEALSSFFRYSNGFNLEFTDEGNGMILSGDEYWPVYLHLFDKSMQSDFVEYLKPFSFTLSSTSADSDNPCIFIHLLIKSPSFLSTL